MPVPAILEYVQPTGRPAPGRLARPARGPRRRGRAARPRAGGGAWAAAGMVRRAAHPGPGPRATPAHAGAGAVGAAVQERPDPPDRPHGGQRAGAARALPVRPPRRVRGAHPAGPQRLPPRRPGPPARHPGALRAPPRRPGGGHPVRGAGARHRRGPPGRCGPAPAGAMTTRGPAADRAGSAGHGGPEEPLAPSEAERARETLQVAILAFRWVALGWMTVAALTSGSVRRPLLAWVAIA